MSDFEVGDLIRYGKYKNKKGKIVSFDEDEKGNATVEIEPQPKGKKKNVTMGLYKIWIEPAKEEKTDESVSSLKAFISETLVQKRL